MKRFLIGICLLSIWVSGFSTVLDSCRYILHVSVNCHHGVMADLIVITTGDNGQVDSLVFHKTDKIKISLLSSREYTIKFVKSGYYTNQLLLGKNYSCMPVYRIIELKQLQIKIDYLPVIHLNLNEFENNSDSDRESIKYIYNILQNNQSIAMNICGFMESDGITENELISGKRATFIKEQLLKLGISRGRLIIENCSNRPYVCRKADRLFPHETILDENYLKTLTGVYLDVARKLNRRVEFEIVTTRKE